MRAVALIVAGICLMAAGRARAELPRLEKPEARKHLEAGLDHYRAKSYVDAAREIERAFALEPRPELLYTWAQALRLAGDCKSAVPLYERFLATAPPEDEALRARKNLTRCRELLPPTPGPSAAGPSAEQMPGPLPALPPGSTPAPVAGAEPPSSPQAASVQSPTAAGKAPAVVAMPTPAPPATQVPWTEDGVAHVLIAGALVSTAGAAGLYFSALDKHQAARVSTVYGDAYDRHREAELRRNLAYGAAGLAVTLVVSTVVRYLLR